MGTQLGEAVEFLDEHPGQIVFITIDLGANDLFDCNGDPSCFIPQIATALTHNLNTLCDHAGPGVPIIGMNYYKPGVADCSTTERLAGPPPRTSSRSTPSWSRRMPGSACRCQTSGRPLLSPIS